MPPIRDLLAYSHDACFRSALDMGFESEALPPASIYIITKNRPGRITEGGKLVEGSLVVLKYFLT